MAYTTAQLEALEEAISSGALEVQYSDRRVKYQSLAEMRKLRRQMQEELGIVPSGAGVRRRVSFSKGLTNGCD